MISDLIKFTCSLEVISKEFKKIKEDLNLDTNEMNIFENSNISYNYSNRKELDVVILDPMVINKEFKEIREQLGLKQETTL